MAEDFQLNDAMGLLSELGRRLTAEWQEALDIESYRIEPGDSVNVVVSLDNGDQSTGTSHAPRIDYTQGSFEFSAETNMTLTLADNSCPSAR